jgi:hypothetical protein
MSGRAEIFPCSLKTTTEVIRIYDILVSASFSSLLVPKTEPASVVEAVVHGLAKEGFELQPGPILFSRFLGGAEEQRVFLVSNDHWCVVIHQPGEDEAWKLKFALRRFSAVVWLWAREGGWGYRLDENGNRVTSYCSKAGLEERDEPKARVKSDIRRLCEVCEIEQVEAALRRVERAYFFNEGKAVARFAERLKAPVALLNFHDLDRALAGRLEPQMIQGWRVQLLAFKKSTTPAPSSRSLAEGARTGCGGWDCSLEPSKRSRWYRWLLLPFVPLVALGGFVLLTLLFLFGGALTILHFLPGARRFYHGEPKLYCENFVQAIDAAKPPPIEIDGEVAINRRYRCRITVPRPAKVLVKFAPRKLRDEDLVFDIELENVLLSCSAWRPGKTPTYSAGGYEVVEQRFLRGNGWAGQFAKRRARSNVSGAWLEWIVETAEADYRFSCHDSGMSADQMELCEKMVHSFELTTQAIGAG